MHCNRIVHLNFAIVNCLFPNTVAHHKYLLTGFKFAVSSYSCAQFEALHHVGRRAQTSCPSLSPLLSLTRSGLCCGVGTLSTKKRVPEIRKVALGFTGGSLFSHSRDFAPGQLLLGTDLWKTELLATALSCLPPFCIEYVESFIHSTHSKEEVGVKEERAPYASRRAVGRYSGLTSMSPYKGRP